MAQEPLVLTAAEWHERWRRIFEQAMRELPERVRELEERKRAEGEEDDEARPPRPS